MPLYTFRNNDTDEHWDDLMGISESELFLQNNPNIVKVPVACNLIGGTGDRVKTDGGMNEMLSRIARANPTSPLAERYGSKGIKETKTRAAVNKIKAKIGGSLT
jgi:hypothetical protein